MTALFIINESENSIYGRRIINLSSHFKTISAYRIIYRDNDAKLKSIFKFINEIIRQKPEIVYVEQIAFSGCIAVIIARLFVRFKYVLCVSDAYAELVKANHDKAIIVSLAKIFENIWLRAADYLLTCNPLHADLISSRPPLRSVDYIEHAVDTELFRPLRAEGLRRDLGLEGSLVVGIVGSIIWARRYNFCYGWEVVEALKFLKDLDIKALIVGEGSGLERLQNMAREYRIDDRVIFTGKIRHEKIANYINCMDVCLSTQSNDAVGYVRCPAKLSEYMACGKYIISTDVGYARLYVERVGELLPYRGVKDDSYPERLAEHLRTLYSNRDLLKKGEAGISIVRDSLQNKMLSQKLESILNDLADER